MRFGAFEETEDGDGGGGDEEEYYDDEEEDSEDDETRARHQVSPLSSIPIRLLNTAGMIDFAVIHRDNPIGISCTGVVSDKRVQGLLPPRITINGRVQLGKVEEFINEVCDKGGSRFIATIRLFVPNTDEHAGPSSPYAAFCNEMMRDRRAGNVPYLPQFIIVFIIIHSYLSSYPFPSSSSSSSSSSSPSSSPSHTQTNLTPLPWSFDLFRVASLARLTHTHPPPHTPPYHPHTPTPSYPPHTPSYPPSYPPHTLISTPTPPHPLPLTPPGISKIQRVGHDPIDVYLVPPQLKSAITALRHVPGDDSDRFVLHGVVVSKAEGNADAETNLPLSRPSVFHSSILSIHLIHPLSTYPPFQPSLAPPSQPSHSTLSTLSPQATMTSFRPFPTTSPSKK